LRDVNTEHQKSDKIEKGSPHYSIAGPQHPRGNEGSYRIGGIMQSIEKVKRQSNYNQAN
jgi:hypothetical protein